MKTAILQVADTGPLESLVVMLRSVGYQGFLPNSELKRRMRAAGCDTVLDIADLVKGMGYDKPFPMAEVGPEHVDKCSLFVDVKAHRNYYHLIREWPSLSPKMLWYRINGGRPEIVPGCGNEIEPPCPVLTPNLWYSDPMSVPKKTLDKSYAVWPPFYRHDEYDSPRPTHDVHDRVHHINYSNPICLIHNVVGWGYGELVRPLRELGVRCHGAGSPDGLINHREVGVRLSRALAMVHLKSSDAPGYALYEALAAACPVVCTRRLIWRNRMEEMFVPGETCLVFDRETHDALTPDDVAKCRDEVRAALALLSNRTENLRIGGAGRKRLRELMWDETRDADSLASFLERNYKK